MVIRLPQPVVNKKLSTDIGPPRRSQARNHSLSVERAPLVRLAMQELSPERYLRCLQPRDPSPQVRQPHELSPQRPGRVRLPLQSQELSPHRTTQVRMALQPQELSSQRTPQEQVLVQPQELSSQRAPHVQPASQLHELSAQGAPQVRHAVDPQERRAPKHWQSPRTASKKLASENPTPRMPSVSLNAVEALQSMLKSDGMPLRLSLGSVRKSQQLVAHHVQSQNLGGAREAAAPVLRSQHLVAQQMQSHKSFSAREAAAPGQGQPRPAATGSAVASVVRRVASGGVLGTAALQAQSQRAAECSPRLEGLASLREPGLLPVAADGVPCPVVRKASTMQKEIAASKKAEAGFPTTGKPITVKLMCMRSESSVPVLVREFDGCQVTSDWDLGHLLEVSERLTGLPRRAQRLYHAGKEIGPGHTIRGVLGLEEPELPAKLAVRVVVDEDSLREN